MEIGGKKVEEIQQDVAELKQDVSRLKQDVSGVKQDVSGLRKDVTEVQLTLENETNKNIRIIAEGHLDIIRKLNNALECV